MITMLLHGLAGLALAVAPTDPCALLTKAEAEAILGKPIATPEQGSVSTCSYTAQAGNGEIMIHVLPMQFRTKEEFHAFVVKDTEDLNARTKKSLEGTGASVKETVVEPVPEVGSAAYFVDPALVIFKEGRVLSILADDRKQAVAVAQKALPRF